MDVLAPPPTPPPPQSLSAMLDARNRTAAERDLAEELPWDLSLGRSRARRRAAELRFVPASSRAKRISLGALAALTAGPAASLATGVAAANPGTPTPEPTTTTEYSITLSAGDTGRQVELLQRALGHPRRRHLRPRNRSGGAALPGQPRADASTASSGR